METLRTGEASVTIDHRHGGRLSSLVVAGHELLVPAEEGWPGPTGWGCFPMVPWAGRIRQGRFPWRGETVQVPLGLPPHAIHGTTHLRRWDRTGTGTLSCPLGPDWPWAGTADQELVLSDDSLSAVILVEAREEAMPVSVGWHPWFRRRLDGVDVELDLTAHRMWQRDGDGIPDGTLVDPPPGPWDDCFTELAGPVGLRWPGRLSLEIRSDCEHVVVFDEPDHAVCVEPQTAPPDADNSGTGLAVVTPGQPLVARTTWTWQLDPT